MKWQREILALVGATAGGLIGHMGFLWLINQGFYAMILPGGLMGLGAGMAQRGNVVVAAICGILALALGVFSEWRAFPFVADESFGYFVQHLHQLKPMTLIMIILGAVIAFWIPYRNGGAAAE